MAMRANLQSQWGTADDNAAVLVRFPSALALLESTWTTFDHGVATGPIVYGSTGTLVVEGGANSRRCGWSAAMATRPSTAEPLLRRHDVAMR